MSTAAPPADTARLFVALWPDHRVRQAIVRWRDRWRWPHGARLVAPRDLHVTLHFLGAVPRTRVPVLAAALAWCGEPFELGFGAVPQWGHGLAVVDVVAPPALEALHAAIGEVLRAQALRTEARPLRPHVTLARHAAGAQPPAAPLAVRWPVREFVLVESGGPRGAGYHVLRRYAAGGAAVTSGPPRAT
ncbi:RNA 2',3'-cyclic phosphodiesterase [Calidifontimicrobium sp. SYSU G02091]|uniref:RNA 2',3'-cyclic phosphodiesterase n=1 Tax=Calidifontimicrobium sp. SYSU G02091 TaxID=2926421 RepID=UPI001F5339ED|nr:RNA 2',3'-cyclic phosphodiesterase [Calidifontimicrobium sp. SYSU G02091]MCI1192911.1 RNA 2',3'-cyclic phosphodiesterase [Calidifontimicrobium sp. SYSU G02091]